MSSLFSTVPGLSSMLIAAIVLEVFSLLTMAMVMLMFRGARLRHKHFFLELYGIASDADPAFYPEPVKRLVSHIEFPVLLWIYVLVTAALTVVTLGIFIIQPHLL